MTPSMSVRPRNPLFSPPRPVVGDATRMRPSSSSCRRTIVPWSSPARPVPIGASIAGDTLARPCCSTKGVVRDRKSTRLNSSHSQISYAVFCLKKKKHHCNVYFIDDTSREKLLNDVGTAHDEDIIRRCRPFRLVHF